MINSWRRWLGLICVTAAQLLLGCNIVAPVAYALEGPPKVPAVIELPDRPTVVYVDDRSNVLGRTALRQIIADQASETLMVEKIVKETISPRDAMAIARTETNDSPLPIAELGKRVGAEQIIFLEVESFSISSDGFTPRPQAVCSVRVLDIPNRARLLPPADSPEPAHTLAVDMGVISGDEYASAATRRKVEESLARFTGLRVAQLFYEHEETPLGSRLGAK